MCSSLAQSNRAWSRCRSQLGRAGAGGCSHQSGAATAPIMDLWSTAVPLLHCFLRVLGMGVQNKTHGSLCVSCCVVIINLSYHGTAYHSKHVPTAVPVPWYLRYLPYIPTYTNIPYVHRSQLANCTPCDESALCLSYLRTGKESAQPPWFHNACDNSFFSSR